MDAEAEVRLPRLAVAGASTNRHAHRLPLPARPSAHGAQEYEIVLDTKNDGELKFTNGNGVVVVESFRQRGCRFPVQARARRAVGEGARGAPSGALVTASNAAARGCHR